LSLAALGLTASAAFAQTATSFTDVDADANGELSYAELQVAWPDLTEDEFNAADVDLSTGLSATELSSLQPSAPEAPAAETLPAPADVAPDPAGTLSGASTDAK
jgi:hypothetical protein